MTLQWVSQKHHIQLEPQWKLPRTRYKGPITPQAVPFTVRKASESPPGNVVLYDALSNLFPVSGVEKGTY